MQRTNLSEGRIRGDNEWPVSLRLSMRNTEILRSDERFLGYWVLDSVWFAFNERYAVVSKKI